MNLNGQSQSGRVEKKNLTPQDYIEIFWRRKWWFVLPVVVGTMVAVMYSYSLPALYRSSTLIMVEPQEVPRAYVSSTVTSTVENRLNTISQQLLSRTNLEKIINRFGLYRQHEAATSGLEGVVRRMKTKMLGLFGFDEQKKPGVWNPSEHVGRMREAIEIIVMGGRTKNAFTIAYSGRDPERVRQVTNALASLFIEENLKVRERQAEGTSEFLASELSAAENELRTLEEQLKQFKETHRGALPEQLEANLRTLDRLQLELQTANDTLKNAEERKLFYEQQLASSTSPIGSPALPESTANVLEVELERLQRELIRLQAQFNDNYPDIIILKERINRIKSDKTNSRDTQSEDIKENILNPEQENTRNSQIEKKILSLDLDINSLKERKNQIVSLIRSYERRIEQTYDNELKIFTLTRDYQTSKANYETLLAKRLNAKMSENLEKRQKGERFKVLDPANLPGSPYKPDRARIILLGSLLSGSLGVGLIFLKEYLNPYFRKPEDIYAICDAPVLAAIPRDSITRKNRDGRLVTIEEPDSIVTEQYRVLYAKLYDLHKERSHKVFAISSSLHSEGKTVTTLNLAVVMARDFGKKILLLEGDFKSPVISQYLKAELEGGLVDILLNKTDIQSTLIPFADTLIPFADDNLSVLPAVKSVRNSSGLLSSQRMRDLLEILKEQYDFILVDAPPVLPLSDMQIFEEVVDGVVLIVKAEKTPRDTVVKALDALGPDKLAGIILSDVQQSLPGFHRSAYVRVRESV